MKKLLIILAILSVNLVANDVKSCESIACKSSNFGLEIKEGSKVRQNFKFIQDQSQISKPNLRKTCETLNCIIDDSLENKQAFFRLAALSILNANDEISDTAIDYFRSMEFDLARKLRDKELILKFGCNYELVPFEMKNGVNKVFLKAFVMVDGSEVAKVEINGRVLALRGKFAMTQDIQVYNLKIKELK